MLSATENFSEGQDHSTSSSRAPRRASIWGTAELVGPDATPHPQAGYAATYLVLRSKLHPNCRWLWVLLQSRDNPARIGKFVILSESVGFSIFTFVQHAWQRQEFRIAIQRNHWRWPTMFSAKYIAQVGHKSCQLTTPNNKFRIPVDSRSIRTAAIRVGTTPGLILRLHRAESMATLVHKVHKRVSLYFASFCNAS